MKNFNFLKLLFHLAMILSTLQLVGQGTISGTVIDDTGEPLIGANVIVVGSTDGTITDFDGTFSFNTSESFPITLLVSFTGYNSQEVPLDGPSTSVDVVLSEGVLLGDDVVISASRRKEKVQEAPASVSILTARKLEGTAQATDPTRNLINVPGVQITQQSASRINIELRGGVGLFGTGAFPIKDYRSLVGPGIGTFDSNGAGINNIDLARIEVVRGAGSALYGPGVTSGVVHFITKNPIDYPGTTVEVIGGELSTYGATVRHAGANANKTFGYKINASYKKGGEFTLNGEEGTTSPLTGVYTRQLDKFRQTIVQPDVTNGVVNTGLPGEPLLQLTPRADGNVMQDYWKSLATDLTLEFRPKDNLSITTSAGYNKASSVFYNDLGEGLSQFSEFWGQARMQAGGLFAQLFYVTNDGGTKDRPTFLYQSGNRSPIGRDQLEAQLQYNFDTPGLADGNWTIGMDYRQAVSDTENLVYGRQENDDDFKIIGGYAQGKFALGSKLDLVVAGRFDRFQFLEENAFSPRAALVYKASPQHTFRASYNHASFAPTALEHNIDFPVNVLSPGAVDFWLAGQKNPQTFAANPVIEFVNPNVVAGGLAAATGLPIETFLGLIPFLPEIPASALGTAGLSNDALHAIASGSLLQAMQANGLAALIPMAQQILANGPTGSNGTFFGINAFDGTPLNTLTPTIPGQVGTTKTYEVGYKGLFANKLGVSLDVYRITVNGASDFTQIAPLVSLVGTDYSGFSDVGSQLTALFTSAGVPAANAAQLAGAYTLTATQVVPAFYGTGTVETSAVPANDGVLHIPTGYRIFDSEYTRWGSDLGLEYYVSDDLSFFGNYSWLNATEFEVDQNDGSGQTFQSFLNTPKNKYRLGVNFAKQFGLRANASFQHDDAFNSNNGQYSGIGQEKNLVDAGVGYKFENGLSIDLTAQNLFDSEYRAFPNMPLIGRRVLGKLTYTFGADGPSDMDGDGIKDKKDACPTEAGTKEFMGCPDSDGDGIVDKDDKCPMAAGDALYMGCPDSDGDGVIDSEDNCPNDAGDLNGCPDSDGDGVADKDDDCPNAAGTLSGCPDGDGDGVADKDDNCPTAAGNVGGCPDGDGDGVADKDDKCPTVSARTSDGCPADADGDGVVGAADKCPNAGGIVDANGCPKDSDGDGIADNDDKCPTVGGNVGPDGCTKPVPAKATEVFTRALTGVKFETSRAVLTRQSYAIMDEVVSIMAEYPRLTLSIEGHTDSRGDDDKNMQLSITRAESVMKYLSGKGVDATRMRAVGFGELAPIADNNTAAGRSQNRRVAFRATF